MSFHAPRSTVRLALVGASAAFLAAPAAAVEQPALMIATAPLVTPAQGLSYFGIPASPAAPATRDPLVQERARALRYDVDQIFAFVRDHVETTPAFGLQEGGRGVILNGRGTPFDQAQFLVDALRESDAVSSRGYNPRYVLGQVQVDGGTFSSWFGVPNGAAASRLLANGGIPATVSGTGTTYTVTMLHPWVIATIGGTDYAFDPSLKTYTTQPGVSWQSAMAYSQSGLLAAGGGSGTTTTTGYVDSTFRNQLNTYRSNVEATIASSADGKRADFVIGKRDIVVHPAGENRRTSLPYAVSADRTWTGQIPDPFRSSMKVFMNGVQYGPGKTYYADENTSGTAIAFRFYFNTGTNSYQPINLANLGPELEGKTEFKCDYYLGSQPTVGTATVRVDVDHPYPALSGTYADRSISKPLVNQKCEADAGSNYLQEGGKFYVTADWGYIGSGLSDRLALPAGVARANPDNSGKLLFGPTLTNIARQYSQILDFAGQVSGRKFIIHDLIGVHTLDAVNTKLSSPGSDTFSPATSLTMDFEGAVSAFSDSGTVSEDTSAALLAGFGLAMAEGSVPRQETDAVYDMAALSLFTQHISRASGTPNTSWYQATSSNWNSVRLTVATKWPTADLTAIDAYVADGYTVVVPGNGGLREPPITVTDAGVTRTMALWEGKNANGDGGELKRSAFLAWRPTSVSNTIPDRVAMLIYDPRHKRVLKAGVGVATDPFQKVRKPDMPKAESKDLIRSAINIDGQSGALVYQPPADLKDGFGDFPYALELRRAYDSRVGENSGFGTGWEHNWNHVATLSNNGKAAWGEEGARALGASLVAITAISDLLSSPDARKANAASQVAAWFTDQTINNAVVIDSGLDGNRTYYRQANGSLASGAADGTSLVQTGSPEIGIINRRLYYPVTMTLTDRDGSKRDYAHMVTTQSLIDGRSSPSISSMLSPKGLQLKTWTFPDGVKLTANYFNTLATSDIIGLQSIASNLGPKIEMIAYDYGNTVPFPKCTFVSIHNYIYEIVPYRNSLITYKTSADASMTVTMDPQVTVPHTGDMYGEMGCDSNGQLVNGTAGPAINIQSRAQQVTDAAGKIWKYGRVYSDGLFFDPNFYFRYYVHDKFYKPSSPTAPAVQLTYGLDRNVRRLTDASNVGWDYFNSPFRSEVLSDSQAAAPGKVGSVTLYDRYGQATDRFDPLLRRTVTAYDDLGRVLRVTEPTGDSEGTTYDARGNVLTSSRRPAGGTGPTDITTTYTYGEPATTTTCPLASASTCNKVLTEQDGRLNVANYNWNLNGTLSSVQRPDDKRGVRPTTTIGYGSFTGNDGATISLPTSKTELISSGVSTTTAYTRDPANKFTVTTATVDPGGLNLRTCVKFDAAGNLISLSDPRQVTCP